METIFYQHLKKYSDRLDLYNNGIKDGKIKEFDLELLSKLKNINYGGMPSNIYIYAFPTNFETIGNKVEILSWVYKNYKIVHGFTNSTNEIAFNKYNSKHLDYNSWIEVNYGSNDYVIDLFSMLIIEKKLYYEIENPKIIKVVTSDQVNSHPAREDNEFSEAFVSPDSFIMVIDTLDYLTKISPYKEYLEKEIAKFKSKIDFEQIKFDYLLYMQKVHKK